MKYKYKLSVLSSLDPKTLEEDLNNMSSRGYALVEMGPVFMTFQKTKPNSKKYAAVIHEEATDFETGIDGFDEFCLEAGWHKIAKNGNILIYENGDLEAIHISTDAGVEYANARDSIKKSTVIQGLLLAGTAYFMYYLAFNHALATTLDFLSDYMVMFAVAIVTTLFAMTAANVIFGVYWIVKSDRLMKTSNRYMGLKVYSKMVNCEIMVLLVVTVAFILLMFITRNYLVGVHYIANFLILFVVASFSNGITNHVKNEFSKEYKIRKRILGFLKLVVLVASVIVYVSTPGGSDIYESEGTIWLYKSRDVILEGDGYLYEQYYPKNEKVYDYVLGALAESVDSDEVILEKDGNIFVVNQRMPEEYRQMVLDKAVKF